MKIRAAAYIIGVGVIAGLMVASVMTYLDWRLNPGGIFRDEGATYCPIVWETAISWFWPVGLMVAALATPLVFFLMRRKK